MKREFIYSVVFFLSLFVISSFTQKEQITEAIPVNLVQKGVIDECQIEKIPVVVLPEIEIISKRSKSG